MTLPPSNLDPKYSYMDDLTQKRLPKIGVKVSGTLLKMHVENRQLPKPPAAEQFDSTEAIMALFSAEESPQEESADMPATETISYPEAIRALCNLEKGEQDAANTPRCDAISKVQRELLDAVWDGKRIDVLQGKLAGLLHDPSETINVAENPEDAVRMAEEVVSAANAARHRFKTGFVGRGGSTLQ